MYELKRIKENWLLRRKGGRFVRLPILKYATDVQISEHFIIADDAIYEIIENNDGIVIVAVPEVAMKCDRSQSAVPQLKTQHRHYNETQTVSSLDEEKERKTLTHNVSDETEPDFKETKTKLEMMNKSSLKHEAPLYLVLEELSEDIKSLTTGSDELNKYTQSLEAGSAHEYEEILDKETAALTSKASVRDQNDDAYDMKKQQKAAGDDVSLTSDHTFVVDVIHSDIAKACGLNGTVICLIENEAIMFRNSITEEVIYSFPYSWIRRYRKTREMFNFEIGRKCPYGPGTIEFCTKSGSKIHCLVTKITQSKKVVQVTHPDCRKKLQFSKMN